jgi:hypothetical protein
MRRVTPSPDVIWHFSESLLGVRIVDMCDFIAEPLIFVVAPLK